MLAIGSSLLTAVVSFAAGIAAGRAWRTGESADDPGPIVIRAIAPADHRPFGTKDCEVEELRSGGYRVTGELVNPYDQAFDRLYLYLMFRDVTGDLLASELVEIEHLPANGTAPFAKETGDQEPPGATTLEIIGMPRGGWVS